MVNEPNETAKCELCQTPVELFVPPGQRLAGRPVRCHKHLVYQPNQLYELGKSDYMQLRRRQHQFCAAPQNERFYDMGYRDAAQKDAKERRKKR